MIFPFQIYEDLGAMGSVHRPTSLQILYLRYDKDGPLAGCLLCVSGDGTIAVIALDDYSL